MTDEDRRLLEVLSKSANGCTDAQLLLSGFMPHQMVSMVRAGVVTAKPASAAGRPSADMCVQISESGRRALRNFPCQANKPQK
jgi:hypothetical protein